MTITFFDSTGAQVSSAYDLAVAAHATTGISLAGLGPNHCEIVVDGPAESFRASIDVIDGSGLVTALPVQ